MSRATAHASSNRQVAPPRSARSSSSRRAPPVARAVAGSAPVVAGCTCGGGCPRCEGTVSNPAFAGVRLHPSAPEITTPLRARAVTLGQDVYFHPGEFQPGTPEGETLIGHELAHTLQARQGETRTAPEVPTTVSSAGDALEDNAEALAEGKTSHVLAAPAGAALRTPFDGEGADDSARRTRLIQSVHNAQATIIRLLQTGGLAADAEVASERAGVHGVIVPPGTSGRSDENFVSYSDREAILRRIVRNLIAMATYYRTNPIPGTLPPAMADESDTFTTRIRTGDGTASYGSANPDWSQLQAAYELYRISQGQTGEDYLVDWYYLTPNLAITPGAARGARRIGRGTPSGAYMVFPDIDGEPLRYWRLTGFETIPRGSVIIEFWHDELGYYYTHRRQRIDVPNPWSR